MYKSNRVALKPEKYIEKAYNIKYLLCFCGAILLLCVTLAVDIAAIQVLAALGGVVLSICSIVTLINLAPERDRELQAHIARTSVVNHTCHKEMTIEYLAQKLSRLGFSVQEYGDEGFVARKTEGIWRVVFILSANMGQGTAFAKELYRYYLQRGEKGSWFLLLDFLDGKAAHGKLPLFCEPRLEYNLRKNVGGAFTGITLAYDKREKVLKYADGVENVVWLKRSSQIPCLIGWIHAIFDEFMAESPEGVK